MIDILSAAKFITPELGELPPALKARLGDSNKNLVSFGCSGLDMRWRDLNNKSLYSFIHSQIATTYVWLYIHDNTSHQLI